MSSVVTSDRSSSKKSKEKKDKKEKKGKGKELDPPQEASAEQNESEFTFPFLLYAFGYTPFPPGSNIPVTDQFFIAEYLDFDNSHLNNRKYLFEFVGVREQGQTEMLFASPGQQDSISPEEIRLIEAWYDRLIDPKSNWYPWEKIHGFLSWIMNLGQLHPRDFESFDELYQVYKGKLPLLDRKTSDMELLPYKAKVLDMAILWIVAIDNVFNFPATDDFLAEFEQPVLPMTVGDILDYVIVMESAL